MRTNDELVGQTIGILHTRNNEQVSAIKSTVFVASWPQFPKYQLYHMYVDIQNGCIISRMSWTEVSDEVHVVPRRAAPATPCYTAQLHQCT